MDSDSEMRYDKYEATVSSEILDLGQTGVNGSGWGWERLEIKKYRHRGLAYQIYLRIE